MNISKDQIDELKQLSDGIMACEEAGKTYFLIPHLLLPEGCSPQVVDALLCPSPRDGYSARLFFSENIKTHHNLNWNGTLRILERNWYAFSWTVEPNLRLVQIIAAIVKALR